VDFTKKKSFNLRTLPINFKRWERGRTVSHRGEGGGEELWVVAFSFIGEGDFGVSK
jgi:hypothetical protein